ncbi:MAG: YodL domain-containing protein [Muribaculaceae bacterium]|nr:YodL domain-containing protein [Muribaculaceae bacterium]
MARNFDVNNIEDLDESIKVKYAVYHTGNGEVVMPTEAELAEIRNNLDDIIGDIMPYPTDESYLHPWQNTDDVLYDLSELWKEKHSADPQFFYDNDSEVYLLPERLDPISRINGIESYDTLSAIAQVKLAGSEWLAPYDAVVEMNRRGIDLNDIEMLNVNVVDKFGNAEQWDIIPEQLAIFENRITDDPQAYSDIIRNYKKKAEKEKTIDISNLDDVIEKISTLIAADSTVVNAYINSDEQNYLSEINPAIERIFNDVILGNRDIGYSVSEFAPLYNAYYESVEVRSNFQSLVAENVTAALVIEKARETAHSAGLPFREAPADEDNTEDFNPYVFDGTMSSEDYELMHKLMREDSFEIYQVKSGDEYRNKRFVGMSELDGTPNIADYELVYSGRLAEQDITAENKDEILESVFDKFNNDRPEDFNGHSLSVSDIVVLHKNGEDTVHYVDNAGFSDVPEFLKEKAEITENSQIENQPQISKEEIVHNAFERVKNNHDFSLKVAELLDRVEKQIIINNEDNFDPKILSFSTFWQTYGKPQRIDEQLFNGGLRDIINEVNANILEQQIPNKIVFENRPYQIVTYDNDAGSDEKEDFPTLEEAQKRAKEYLKDNYDGAGTSACEGYAIYNTETQTIEETSGYFPSEIIFSNDVLVKNGIITEKENSPLGKNETLKEGDLVTFTDRPDTWRVTAITDLQIDFENTNANAAEKFFSHIDFGQHRDNLRENLKYNFVSQNISEKEEPALKTVTNPYSSYHIVQDVIYALQDLQDGTAENYDWQNYTNAFKNVLDSNIHTDVAIPLYKSETDKILSDAANGKTVSADGIAKALSNLELVLQNSHLLKNPEEKTEQISFFDGTPNRKSSDEINFFTSAELLQSEKENSPVGKNPQEENAEKKKSADYTITDKNYGTEGGAKTRFANNVAAIKLMKTIESENRPATPEEQEILAKYVGWGGISNAFDGRKSDWSKEYSELKSLLTDEEFRAAKASTMNAHYTSPTVINAIYSELQNLGFTGGKILEPAMGIGNFLGAMPESIHNNSEIHGVELDEITGRIAKLLYPSADVQIKGFEKTDFENGSFDVAVSNVPFGGYTVYDKEYSKHNFLIHDYFFAKSLDKVRAGGIVAFVTSMGTLDKENPEVRKYLAERAEFLGAIRLPNNAFKSNAGTEVTSDIIFLQKRDRPISIEENPPEWIFKDMLPNGIAVNKYFADHPEMILGEMVEGNKLYGNQTNASMCVPVEGAELSEQLAAAIKNIKGTYKAAEKGNAKVSPVGNDGEILCPLGAPKYSYIVQDDILYYRKADIKMEKVNAPENVCDRIKAMAQLRDTVHNLLDLQLDNSDGSLSELITAAQKNLNDLYDDFAAKYGLISSAENKSVFKSDNSYHLIKSLERLDKDSNFVGKADIFDKITVNPKIVIDHCDNAQDALILSLSEKMCVNLEYMSILTGKSEEKLIDELGDKIFQNPQKNMRWESADEYLTGNIRQKLAAAEAEGLTRNAEALRAVMPERIEAADIAVKLGSAWVDPEYIRQFIVETLKPDFVTSKNIEVTYMPATDKWKVDGWRSAYSNTLATETYGTADINAYEIIEATLNMQKVEVRQRVKDEYGNDLRDKNGRYVYEVNQQKTMIAQSKQDELKRKFSDWIFSVPDRREKLVDVYNEKFNSIRLREYDGSHLNFVGMNSAITLKEHQKNAIARGLYSNGNTLLAHEVGAGKTYEMIAIAMEGKRLGLHHKSLITAPNGLTEQWGSAFRTLYPNANVLVATEKDFQKENRRDLFAKIATGDWDAVIIGYSQFDMIHLSRERELDGLYSEIAHLETALEELTDDDGRKSFSVKQIEKSIKAYEGKIEKLLAKTPEDDMLCFEKLGVDKIFVDESQAYKNLDTPTKMRNVSGIGSGGSGRSMQLLMKCKYLDEITGGRGVTFASGTPISNSMSEMYTLMRYLQADKLAELGINSFDRWASVFGETTTAMELSPEGNGKYQMKTRFAKFQNLPELMNIFKECADIKTAESLDLDRPDFEMHNINVPATAMQALMIKDLGERAKDIRSGAVKPTEDNMCKLTVDGRKIGLDQRCMNPNLPDDPKSKVNVCINNVFDIWQKTAEQKSTQLIFCDLATPQPTLNENTYTVYRKNPHGNYDDVYTAKLGERDTAEKIVNKLNGKKPPKNYETGDISDGDIVLLKRVNYEEETAYNTAFVMKNGKLAEISPEMWEKLHRKPIENFESERRFCVYDDIKQKLIEKGVPEKEIAFIHDAEKSEDKQRLYDKMNKGEIRVLIGSTQKCGAGMNAQERMIALHDLDAPMRPSDMSQRHGRIIRQGNTNGKVDIYRYTTDKTFDAYLYQMLENKQRFISQIMTDKSPVRSCEDVDEVALDYAEVKALCAGNPLIREKIDLETDITKLNVLKSAFLSQKYSLQDKAYKTLPEHRRYTEYYIENLKFDIEEIAKSVKPLTDKDGKNYYPVTVNGKEYHNKEEAGQAIRQAVISSDDIMHGRECEIGSYRGFKMSIHLKGTEVTAKLSGAAAHYGRLNLNKDVKASGNIVRLDNIINGIELELQKQEDRLQSLTADIKEAEIAAEADFPQEQELIEKEKRLAEVNTLLTNSEVKADNGMELCAALVEICHELEKYDTLYCKYEKGADSGIEPLIVEKNGDTVFIAHTYVQNGDLMYDPAIEFSFDTQNHRAQALSYELSGMGIYEDFRGGDRPESKADVESMALDTMFVNIKSYDYERTKFEFDDNDRAAEKEKGDDFVR